jgi:hypothetical protein
MVPAPAAIFLNFHSVRIVFLVLHRCVIAAFAIITREGDDDAVVLFSHGLNSSAILLSLRPIPRLRTGHGLTALIVSGLACAHKVKTAQKKKTSLEAQGQVYPFI